MRMSKEISFGVTFSLRIFELKSLYPKTLYTNANKKSKSKEIKNVVKTICTNKNNPKLLLSVPLGGMTIYG